MGSRVLKTKFLELKFRSFAVSFLIGTDVDPIYILYSRAKLRDR